MGTHFQPSHSTQGANAASERPTHAVLGSGVCVRVIVDEEAPTGTLERVVEAMTGVGSLDEARDAVSDLEGAMVSDVISTPDSGHYRAHAGHAELHVSPISDKHTGWLIDWPLTDVDERSPPH